MTDPATDPIAPDLKRVLDRIRDREFAAHYAEASGAFRLAEKARTSAAIRAVNRIRRADARDVTITALGKGNGASKGSEVWLLRASGSAGEPGIPWRYAFSEGFRAEASMYASHGMCLKTAKGRMSFRAGGDPELEFQAFPWGGLVEVCYQDRRETIDLYAPVTRTVLVRPARSPMVEQDVHQPPAEPSAGTGEPSAVAAVTSADEAFLAAVAKAKPQVVAIHCPRWLGISSATRTLFEHCYPVPEDPSVPPNSLSDAVIRRHARVLVESGVGHFVISGGDHAHRRLIEAAKALKPSLVFDVLWHGSYIQVQDNYEWDVLRGWVEASRAGLIRGIGTVKAGMEGFFRSIGVPSALVLNCVPGVPMKPPPIAERPIRAGVWISGATMRKCPHAMLAGLAMMGDVRLHAAGMDARAREFAAFLKLGVGEMHEHTLPQSALPDAIRRTHLSLYVTFSECCPMLPLESLRMGVPCLIGPVSHLFQDHDELYRRLVVPFPDRADVIAEYALRAIADRERIIDAYARYAPGYNQRARESVRRFVDDGPTR